MTVYCSPVPNSTVPGVVHGGEQLPSGVLLTPYIKAHR